MTDTELGALVRLKMKEATEKKKEIYITIPNISGGLSPMDGTRDRAMRSLMQELVADIAEAAGIE